jgi:hypothetical protein
VVGGDGSSTSTTTGGDVVSSVNGKDDSTGDDAVVIGGACCNGGGGGGGTAGSGGRNCGIGPPMVMEVHFILAKYQCCSSGQSCSTLRNNFSSIRFPSIPYTISANVMQTQTDFFQQMIKMKYESFIPASFFSDKCCFTVTLLVALLLL